MKILTIFGCFKVHLGVIIACTEGESETFRVLYKGTTYDVIISKFQGVGCIRIPCWHPCFFLKKCTSTVVVNESCSYFKASECRTPLRDVRSTSAVNTDFFLKKNVHRLLWQMKEYFVANGVFGAFCLLMYDTTCSYFKASERRTPLRDVRSTSAVNTDFFLTKCTSTVVVNENILSLMVWLDLCVCSCYWRGGSNDA